jgi:hypothetical protein
LGLDTRRFLNQIAAAAVRIIQIPEWSMPSSACRTGIINATTEDLSRLVPTTNLPGTPAAHNNWRAIQNKTTNTYIIEIAI